MPASPPEDWKPSTPDERLFAERFCALTLSPDREGHRPFRWQWRLFERFTNGVWPHQIDLPTGIGKTSVIALWVLALGRALESGGSPLAIPRRLAYVVDRRVVVDQASGEAEMIVARLEKATQVGSSDTLHTVARALQNAGCDDSVLALSALRGQRTLDTSWRLDPTRPAIVIGTVDMIGSRLLFSAYGRVGRWGLPYEAGLLAQDCLLILDEAHLSQPFDDTLTEMERLVSERRSIRPFAVIRMGATSRPCSPERSRFLLEDEDRESRVRIRLKAAKRIELHETSESVASDLAQWAVSIARRAPHEKPAIGLVFNTVRGARDAHEELVKLLTDTSLDRNAVLVLTGSMRGIERDEIVSAGGTSPEALLYRRFRGDRDRGGGDVAFLVATSCVEVGADLDLDHLGTEACALDSLVQRLGRVNRRGERNDASVVRVLSATDGAGVTANVMSWLRGSPERLDGSPDGLPRAVAQELDASHEQRMKLCGAPEPVPLLTRATIDDLAMTSLAWDEADRPDISLWLHGCAPDNDGGYVELAWRTELDWVNDERGAASLIDAFPIAPRETARCPLYEAVELLLRLRSQPDQNAEKCIAIVRGGAVRGHRIDSLPEDRNELYRLAAWSQIALPCAAGGYEHHFVNPQTKTAVVDVSDCALPETWAPRRRLWILDGRLYSGPETEGEGTEVADIWLADDSDGLREACEPAVRALLDSEWDAVAAAGSAERGVLVARRRKTRVVETAEDDRGSVGFEKSVTLSQHLDDAGRWAQKLCAKLKLGDFAKVVIEAAKAHDLGKDRAWWQRAIGSTCPPPLAKSGRSGFNHGVNQGYRHELGSLFDLLRQDQSLDDLIAHLVASHHGYGRPGFAIEQAGPVRLPDVEQVIAAVALRFARLHQTLGPWQLAYLEAVVKAADALASREVGS